MGITNMKQVILNIVSFDGLSKQAKSYAKDNLSDFLNDILYLHTQEIKASKDAYLLAYNQGKLDQLNKDDCPLTGVTYDYEFLSIDHKNCDSVKNEANKVFLSLKRLEKKDVYSDESVSDLCEGNEIFFLENGEEYSSLLRLTKGI